MIPIEKLRPVTTLITHADCPDGLASAIIIKDALDGARLRPDAKDLVVKFVRYGTKEHDELAVEPGLLFCDFSPPAKRAAEFLEAGALVLDHHVTAKGLLFDFEVKDQGVYADEPGVSGAVLAYEHVWKRIHETFRPDRPEEVWAVKRFAELTGVRDTWQKKNPLWREACAQAEVLRFWGADVLLARGAAHLYDQQQLELGENLLTIKEREMKQHLEGAWRFVTDRGMRVTVIATTDTSDAAELEGEKADLLVGFRYWCENGYPKFNISLRSRGTFDCGAFAKQHGGGGHKGAAGFTLGMDEGRGPYHRIKWYVEQWEAMLHDG